MDAGPRLIAEQFMEVTPDSICLAGFAVVGNTLATALRRTCNEYSPEAVVISVAATFSWLPPPSLAIQG